MIDAIAEDEPPAQQLNTNEVADPHLALVPYPVEQCGYLPPPVQFGDTNAVGVVASDQNQFPFGDKNGQCSAGGVGCCTIFPFYPIAPMVRGGLG